MSRRAPSTPSVSGLLQQRVLAAADRLARAQQSGHPCAPVRDLIGDDPGAAYAVQRSVVGRRLRNGAVVVGRKVGLTSRAVQAQLGVDQPDYGTLLDDMADEDGATVDTTTLLQPRVEAEVAFVLGSGLDKGALDQAQVRDAVARVVPALEIVDSRIAGWDITFADTVADNGSSARYVLGAGSVSLNEVEPARVRMSMDHNGATVSTGTGEACLGNPLTALRWLARTARDLGNHSGRARWSSRERWARWCRWRRATTSGRRSPSSGP